MSKTYHSTGKWILAGEHSVLRGSRALVFPLPEMVMKLEYEVSSMDLVAQFQGPTGHHYQLLFYGLVDRALEILGRPRKDLKGSIRLSSNIPLGNGLGASAALCVVVGRWFEDLGWVDRSKLESYCRELENLFHGESSGVDIAVVLSGRPLCFSRFAPSEPLDIQWQPPLYLSSSGQKGLTHACVQKVKSFLLENPEQGQRLDEQMGRSVESMLRILRTVPETSETLLHELGQSMSTAQQCFEHWGLTEGALDREIKKLLEAGALAAKPTGSGDGGYVLSLWKEPVPKKLLPQLISCW